MSVSGSIKVTASFTQIQTEQDVSATAAIAEALTLTFAAGTGAGQCDQIYRLYDKSIAANATDSLDLRPASNTSIYGDAVNFAKVKAIILVNTSGTGAVLSVGGNANAVPIFAAVGDMVIVPDGGIFVLALTSATGAFTVTAATGDILDVFCHNDGLAGKYNLLVVGIAA